MNDTRQQAADWWNNHGNKIVLDLAVSRTLVNNEVGHKIGEGGKRAKALGSMIASALIEHMSMERQGTANRDSWNILFSSIAGLAILGMEGTQIAGRAEESMSAVGAVEEMECGCPACLLKRFAESNSQMEQVVRVGTLDELFNLLNNASRR